MKARARLEEIYDLLSVRASAVAEGEDLELLNAWADEVIAEVKGLAEPEGVDGLALELCNSCFHFAFIAANHVKRELRNIGAVASHGSRLLAIGRAREAAYFGALALEVLGAPGERAFVEAASQALEEGMPFVEPEGELCKEVKEGD